MSKQGKTFETRWTDSRGQTYSINLTLNVLEQRPEITSVMIGAVGAGEFITQSALRTIPFKSLVKKAITPAKAGKLSRSDLLVGGVQVELKSHRGRKATQEELVVLVNLYEHAVKNYLPILPTLSDALDLPESTVNKRLIAARKKGLISSLRERPSRQMSGSKPRRKNAKTTKRPTGS